MIRIPGLTLGRNDRGLADRVLADRILADRELSDWSGLLDRLRMRQVRRKSRSDKGKRWSANNEDFEH
jgi:hypothetical protein